MLFDEFRSQRLSSSDHCKPPRPLPLSAGLCATHEVPFAHDSQEFAVNSDNRNGADPICKKRMSDVLDTGVWANRNYICHHHVSGFHGSDSSVRKFTLNERWCRSLMCIKEVG